MKNIKQWLLLIPLIAGCQLHEFKDAPQVTSCDADAGVDAGGCTVQSTGGGSSVAGSTGGSSSTGTSSTGTAPCKCDCTNDRANGIACTVCASASQCIDGTGGKSGTGGAASTTAPQATGGSSSTTTPSTGGTPSATGGATSIATQTTGGSSTTTTKATGGTSSAATGGTGSSSTGGSAGSTSTPVTLILDFWARATWPSFALSYQVDSGSQLYTANCTGDGAQRECLINVNNGNAIRISVATGQTSFGTRIPGFEPTTHYRTAFSSVLFYRQTTTGKTPIEFALVNSTDGTTADFTIYPNGVNPKNVADPDGDGATGSNDCDEGNPSRRHNIAPGDGENPGNPVDEDCDDSLVVSTTTPGTTTPQVRTLNYYIFDGTAGVALSNGLTVTLTIHTPAARSGQQVGCTYDQYPDPASNFVKTGGYLCQVSVDRTLPFTYQVQLGTAAYLAGYECSGNCSVVANRTPFAYYRAYVTDSGSPVAALDNNLTNLTFPVRMFAEFPIDPTSKAVNYDGCDVYLPATW